MLVGPWSSLTSAMTESGTPPFSPCSPSGTRNCSSVFRLPRAASSSCTRIGTRRSPTSNLASAGPTSPIVATRMVCDRLSVETPRRAARSARGSMRSSGRSSEVSEITSEMVEIRFICVASALAVLVQEPEADVGDVLQLLTDREFQLALSDVAVVLRRVVDDQGGAADFLGPRWNTPAVDENALDLGPLAQSCDDVLGDLLGVGELGTRRQFEGQQRPRAVLRRQEALRQ